jgi:hypothetical protein
MADPVSIGTIVQVVSSAFGLFGGKGSTKLGRALSSTVKRNAAERAARNNAGNAAPPAVIQAGAVAPITGPVSVTPAQFLPFSRSLVEGTGPLIAQTALLGTILRGAREILKRRRSGRIPQPQPRQTQPQPRQPGASRTRPRQGERERKTFRTKREEALEAIRQRAEQQSSPIPGRPPTRAPGPIIQDDPFRRDFPLPAPKTEPIPEIVSRPEFPLPKKPVLSPALLQNLVKFGLTVAIGAAVGRGTARQPTRGAARAPARPPTAPPAGPPIAPVAGLGVSTATLVQAPPFARDIARQRLASQFQNPARQVGRQRDRCPPCDKPRRRNRKTCWEGFYAEYSKRTEFKKWRQVDCLTRRTIQES